MFNHSRVFSDRNPTTGNMEWFAETREGMLGPFDSEKLATEALQRHIEYTKQQKIDGGRGLGLEKRPTKLELERQR
jgi:hypothetical protein